MLTIKVIAECHHWLCEDWLQ